MTPASTGDVYSDHRPKKIASELLKLVFGPDPRRRRWVGGWVRWGAEGEERRKSRTKHTPH